MRKHKSLVTFSLSERHKLPGCPCKTCHSFKFPFLPSPVAPKPLERPSPLPPGDRHPGSREHITTKQPAKKLSAWLDNNNKKKGKIFLRTMRQMKTSLGLSGSRVENVLQSKRQKQGIKMPCQQVKAKPFCFVSPRDRVERHAFLHGFF